MERFLVIFRWCIKCYIHTVWNETQLTPSGSALAVPKFMLSMREKAFAIISSEAEKRGVTVQELLRAVIVPEWARENLQPSIITQTTMQITPHQTKPSMPSKQRDSKLAITVGQLRT